MVRTLNIASGLALGCALALAAPCGGAWAKSYKVLYDFAFQGGVSPAAGLTAGKAGDLFGTTTFGGAGDCTGNIECGTVFELAPNGTQTVLYSFCSKPSCSDGEAPTSVLLKDKAGNLYGSTTYGGIGCIHGCGTVFKLAPDGTETRLYAFGGGSDGAEPNDLLTDKAGNFYGTAEGGGNLNCFGGDGCGVVFKLTPGGTQTVLYAFCSQQNCSDGYLPVGALIRDGAGNFYGTTQRGGANGFGAVFKLTPDGTETVLYAFAGGNDGASPDAGLIMDKAGNLYGTTFNGGGGTGCFGNGCGTVFMLAPNGTETVLHVFTGGSDGAEPNAKLMADKKGDLFGTTLAGGNSSCGIGCGTVFMLKPNHREKVLYTFCSQANCSDGSQPVGGVISAKHKLYGVTSGGGAASGGVVFQVKG